MKFKFLLVAFFATLSGFAQKGTVAGMITDKNLNNEVLPFATVLVKGTTNGTNTDENGKYTLTVSEGSHVLVVSFLGYESAEVPFTIAANETKTINLALDMKGVALEDVVIKTEPNRHKETTLLAEQKKAVEIKQTIGAQELSRKGVSDVATAVAKTTGITKQEGSGNIYVRGLGDRYNSTTLNGLPIPSNNPEKKNISLDIFPTDIVELVSIDKVYTGRITGDFAGGNIDIVSKDFKGIGMFRLDIGTGANTNAVSEDHFKLQKGYNVFGFSNPSNPKTIGTYEFKTLTMEERAPFSGSFGVSGGKSFNVGVSGKLSVFATGSFNNEYTSRQHGRVKGGVNGDASLINKDFETYSANGYNTNTTGLANIGYKINSNHKINFNSVFINTSGESNSEYFGYVADLANDRNGLIRRTKYEKNTLSISQLLGEHKFGERIKANWGMARNTIEGDMPDRVTNSFRKTDTGYQIISQSRPDNNRYYQRLTEEENVVNASLSYAFQKNQNEEFKGKLTAGYNGRSKTRTFKATQFNFKTEVPYLTTLVDIDNLDLFYNPENYTNGYFNIFTYSGGVDDPAALTPQRYTGAQYIHGIYLTADYKFSDKLTASLSVRGETIYQKVKWKTQLDPIGAKDVFEKNAFLPNAILKYEVNNKQNLRFGTSKTYTLPQFKERALFVYEEIDEVKVGNPYLYPSDNYNVDIKWELFPKSEEIISVGAFGKYIMNPINEITIASSTNDISFVNTGDKGYVAGIEAEVRKVIGEFSNNKLTAGLNASYMYTTQDLSSEKVQKETKYGVVFTNSKSGFTGASPLLVNADLTLLREWNNKESNIMGTLAYSYFSDRLYSIGTNFRGDVVDKAVSTLDFIFKSKINKNLGLNFSAKNLLNPKIERVQENNNGDVTLLTYTKGISLSLGMNYQF
ncbi:TonB-dependent receptor domain-containing protein [Flavobacterium suncheonense]|uniref:TonB-dependent receptor n=1 Tax=Flavobacterium suncheonense TaxID=350894 RepID=UPI003FA3C279